MRNDLLAKIKKAELVGRGGAGFSTALKWKIVKKAEGKKKYVICNASEGEIGVFKDLHILKNYPEQVFKGLRLAMDYIGTREAYFNINQNYYRQIKRKIIPTIRRYEKKGYHFTIYEEPPSYIGGEETALLNAIEGKRLQPKMKPPYPSEKGLFNKPTLIHNVETLFNIANVAEGTFKNKRFYSISGLVKNSGVFHLPTNWPVLKVLEETENVPPFDYFVQIGGSASGLVLNKKQITEQKMIGAGSIEVYRSNMPTKDLLLKWFSFYNEQSCGKCTPCREGTYQLYKLVKNCKKIPWGEIMEIVEVLEETSFCALGKSVALPVKSYLKNILENKSQVTSHKSQEKLKIKI